MTPAKDNCAVGTTWTQEVLGSTASYRVVENLGDVVVVSVMEAPGLEPGTTLRLRREALQRMEPMGATERSPAHSSRPAHMRHLPASEH